MNLKRIFIVFGFIAILFLVFIPFIDQPERVYKEFNLLIIIGFLGFSFLFSYPNIFQKNKKGDIKLAGPNSPSALFLLAIILGFFIYRPYIEFCKPLVELVPTIAFVLFMNYFVLLIFLRLKENNFKINSQNMQVVILIAVVGINLYWLFNNLPFFISQAEQSLQCFY